MKYRLLTMFKEAKRNAIINPIYILTRLTLIFDYDNHHRHDDANGGKGWEERKKFWSSLSHFDLISSFDDLFGFLFMTSIIVIIITIK